VRGGGGGGERERERERSACSFGGQQMGLKYWWHCPMIRHADRRMA
jgi:hypothetical protein